MLLADLAWEYFLAETFTKGISQLLIHLWPKDNYVIIQRTLLYIILAICILIGSERVGNFGNQCNLQIS